MSNVIISSSAKVVLDKTAGVLAVTLVFSLASIVSLVDNIVAGLVAPELMSTVITEPTGAVETLILGN
jgi:hypothetical protein